MRAFAYVTARRWTVFLLAAVILVVVGVASLSLGHPGPMLAAAAALAVAIPLRLIRVLRLTTQFGSPGWDREIWGPDLEDYPAQAAPFSTQRSSATMLRSALTTNAWGLKGARFERFDVVNGYPLFGRGTHVEVLHLDHDMPTVQFGRKSGQAAGPGGMDPNVSGHGLTYMGANVRFQGDELLVSRWLTDNAVGALDELLEHVPFVTLSGSMLYAHGHAAGNGDNWNPQVLYLITQLAAELRPALRREFGFPIDTDPAVQLPVTGKRGSRTFVWAGLFSNLVFAPLGAVLGLGAVSAPSERSGKWRLAAWGVWVMSLVQTAGMVAVVAYVESSSPGWFETEQPGEPFEVETDFQGPGEGEPETDFPWDREQPDHRQELDDAVSGIEDLMEDVPGA